MSTAGIVSVITAFENVYCPHFIKIKMPGTIDNRI